MRLKYQIFFECTQKFIHAIQTLSLYLRKGASTQRGMEYQPKYPCSLLLAYLDAWFPPSSHNAESTKIAHHSNLNLGILIPELQKDELALTCFSHYFPEANSRRPQWKREGRSELATYPLWFSASFPLSRQLPVWGMLNRSKWGAETTQRLIFVGDYKHFRSHSTVKKKLQLVCRTKVN